VNVEAQKEGDNREFGETFRAGEGVPEKGRRNSTRCAGGGKGGARRGARGIFGNIFFGERGNSKKKKRDVIWKRRGTSVNKKLHLLGQRRKLSMDLVLFLKGGRKSPKQKKLSDGEKTLKLIFSFKETYQNILMRAV